MERTESKLCEYIQQIYLKVEKLKKENTTKENENLIIAYRGETKLHKGSELMPTLYRTGNNRGEEYLHNLLQDYQIIDNNVSNEFIKAVYAQHYVEISRLLDISFNVLSSLFFACERNEEFDGLIYIFAFPETYSPNSKYIEEFYNDIVHSQNSIYPKNFKVITMGRFHDRIIAQDGGFILFPGKNFHPIDKAYYEVVTVKKEDKADIINELKMLFDIDKYSVYPEIKNQSDRVKERYINQKAFRDDIDSQNDLDSALSRILYEYKIKLKKKTGEENNKKIVLRWLRKEKKDILSFYGNGEDEKRVNDTVEKINHFFDSIIF